MRKNGFPIDARYPYSTQGRKEAWIVMRPTSDDPTRSTRKDGCEGNLVRGVGTYQAIDTSPDGLVEA